jgi:hypothetical protein
VSALAAAVDKLAEPWPVTIRTELVYGSDGRPDGSQTESTFTIRMSIQPTTDRPTELLRLADGDETTGQIRVHVSDAALAATGEPSVANGLPIAPPEDTDGPPGALIAWQGRLWEVVELQAWERQGFTGRSKFRRYIAEERGAA